MISSNQCWLLAGLTLCCLAFSFGCDRPPDGHRISPFNSVRDAASAMKLYDTNHDGKISDDELDAVPGLKASLALLKTDSKKGVTSELLAERLKNWNDSRIGRMALAVALTHNGRPLVDATVKFIPEKFLSEDLPDAATGTTRKDGVAIVSLPTIPDSELPPGVPPGMYRIEITKADEDIPAQYNSATELGQEISIDNPDLQNGIMFDLKY
jgi:hypothetical protein